MVGMYDRIYLVEEAWNRENCRHRTPLYFEERLRLQHLDIDVNESLTPMD